MSLREATLADANAVASVNVASWRSTYRGILPDGYLDGLIPESRVLFFRQRLASEDPDHFTLVAETPAGEIVGYLSAGPERAGSGNFPMEIYGLYLLRDHQRKGLGTNLLKTAAARVLQTGHSAMLAWVIAANSASRFYERLGATHVGRRHLEIGGCIVEELSYGWTDLRQLATV